MHKLLLAMKCVLQGDIIMEIKVQDYCQAITQEVYDWQSVSLTTKQIESRQLNELLSAFYVQLTTDLQNNKLAKLQIMVDDAVNLTSFAVETSIINLPWADIKKVTNFFNNNEVVPVNLYFITESPDVNQSGLRIDEFTSVESFLQNPAMQQQALTSLFQQNMQMLIAKQHDKK